MSVIAPEWTRAASALWDERQVHASVLVVDTQTLFRSGLAHLLSEDDHLSVVGTSEGGEDIPQQCREMSVDVVLTDIQVRHWDGIELTRAICRVSPRTRVLILASVADWRVIPAMASGAAGFLLKDAEPVAVRSAVLSAHLGEQVLCAEAARWLLQETPDYRLTRREHDVLRMVARGAANKEIAESLQLGDKTVRNYVSRLYRKLAMHNRAEISSAVWQAHPANSRALVRPEGSK
jgi:DNA-binding NarL/FixJ family response regulator